MIDKLEKVEERFESVNEMLCDPDVVADMEKYKKLMREMKNLTPVVEKFREYKKTKETLLKYPRPYGQIKKKPL